MLRAISCLNPSLFGTVIPYIAPKILNVQNTCDTARDLARCFVLGSVSHGWIPLARLVICSLLIFVVSFV